MFHWAIVGARPRASSTSAQARLGELYEHRLLGHPSLWSLELECGRLPTVPHGCHSRLPPKARDPTGTDRIFMPFHNLVLEVLQQHFILPHFFTEVGTKAPLWGKKGHGLWLIMDSDRTSPWRNTWDQKCCWNQFLENTINLACSQITWPDPSGRPS